MWGKDSDLVPHSIVREVRKLANKNQFTRQFMQQMSHSSAQTADSYSRLVDLITSLDERMGSIDDNLKQVLSGQGLGSQSAANDRAQSRRGSSTPFADHHANFQDNSTTGRRGRSLQEEISKSLTKALEGKEFQQAMKGSLQNFANKFSQRLDEINTEATKQLEQQILNSIKGNRVGSRISAAVSSLTDRIVESINSANADVSGYAEARDRAQQAANSANADVSGSTRIDTASIDFDAFLEPLTSINENIQLLHAINENVRVLVEGRDFSAQGNRANNPSSNGPGPGRGNTRDPFEEFFNQPKQANKKSGEVWERILNTFEETVIDNIGGAEFKDRIKEVGQQFADHLEVDLNDVPEEVGKKFGQMFSKDFKESKLGSNITEKFSEFTENFGKNAGQFGDVIKNLGQGGAGEGGFASFLQGIKGIEMKGFAGAVKNGAVAVGEKLVGSVGGFGAAAIIAVAAIKIFTTGMKGAGKAVEGFKELFKGLSAAANRYSESREKNLKAAQERLESDVRTLITYPFDILKKAADEVYSAWNQNIRLIGQTQGYNKEDLQDLMSSYAQRLQQEGLSNVISSTDIYNNLAKVIQSGLTGNAAVEFAYQATKMNAAMPNQDFFNYVDTYASVAANAIAAGKSEAEALNLANSSLSDFSNSLLYASRNLTGGFSTGLRSAENIYTSAVKIAQSARSDNISGIANTLLAIQGYVGSIAPDLANTLSDKIYQLATGGNNADIVALRSLAGINASNTDFLRALSTNPEGVLSTMFANLGKMFTQSADAYMEKAEGYASLFGLSSDAFARIDFASLANAIVNMESNTNNLEDNMKLLKEGQTTTSTDQLKIAQINQYMIEEGLAYVIDNEAAQMIQEHMWQEQQTRELQEAEYGVNLVGSSASALEKIVSGVELIVNLLNPIAWLSKLGNIIKTADEASDLQADIKGLLENVVVGQGNRSDLYNLTTRNANLNLTRNLVDIVGGKGAYGNSWYNGAVEDVLSTLAHPLTQSLTNSQNNLLGRFGAKIDDFFSVNNVSTPSSRYTWGSISKSSAAVAGNLVKSTIGHVSTETVSQVTGAVSSSVALIQEKLKTLLSDEYMQTRFIQQGKSYEEWKESARSQGITDIDSAMAEAGYDPDSVEAYFLAKQTEAGMAEKFTTAEDEKSFREAGRSFWNTRFWDEYNTPLTYSMNSVISRVDTLISIQSEWRDQQLDKMQAVLDNQIKWQEYFNTAWVEEQWKTNFVGESGYFTKFFDEFVKKFIEHEYYDEANINYTEVDKVKRREDAEKGDAVYALAEALTGNLVDLKDPQVQTNALLAKILIVVSAIMNQSNNVAGTTSLSDALSSLAIGLTNTTPLDETPSVMSV